MTVFCKLQGEVDAIKIQSLDNEQILYDARNLHKQWKSFTKGEKKSIIEAITESIKVGKEDIVINLSYIPTLASESHPSLPRFMVDRPANPAYPCELKTLGDHLRKARLDRGLFQTDVAKLLNVTADTVTGWELNRHDPPARYAKCIIAFLGYQPFAFEGEPIGKQLLFGRLTKGHTQRQAANALGCDYTTVQHVERGKRQPGERVTAEIQKYISSFAEK